MPNAPSGNCDAAQAGRGPRSSSPGNEMALGYSELLGEPLCTSTTSSAVTSSWASRETAHTRRKIKQSYWYHQNLGAEICSDPTQTTLACIGLAEAFSQPGAARRAIALRQPHLYMHKPPHTKSVNIQSKKRIPPACSSSTWRRLLLQASSSCF